MTATSRGSAGGRVRPNSRIPLFFKDLAEGGPGGGLVFLVISRTYGALRGFPSDIKDLQAIRGRRRLIFPYKSRTCGHLSSCGG